MAIRDLVTKFGKKALAVQRSEADPIHSLHQEINRVFEHFSRGFLEDWPLSTQLSESTVWKDFSPQVDIRENEQQIEITAELPGLDEKDVQVSLANHELVIRGEKKSENERKGKGWHRMERSYGSFHRVIALPEGVETEAAEAVLKKGLLTVTLPKRAETTSRSKKIAIRRA
jgi:HSP20 family protein